MSSEPDDDGRTIDVPLDQTEITDFSVQPAASTSEATIDSPPNQPELPQTVSVVVDGLVTTEIDGSGVQRQAYAAALQTAAPPGYEILGILGRGGMGVVYDARQIALKRRVALKMVTAGVHSDPQQHARFQIEAESVAALQHPNIVQIYEVGEHAGVPYFSLELIDGGSLEERIRSGPMSPNETAEIMRKLADAMHYAHERGIIHRDLKPGNVLMTADGQPKISDFGLAKRLDSIDTSQTQAGTILGTPSYMSPEQASGDIEAIGPASDVYALGAMLYRMLTGQPPFQGATLVETLDAVRAKEPTPVRQLQPKAPRDLEVICLTCLQKPKARRYASAEALARDLGHFLAGEPIEARPVSAAERLWRWCQRNPGIAALTAAVFALLATVAITSSVLAYRIDREKKQTELERQVAIAAQALAEKNESMARAAEQKAIDNARIAVEQGRLAVSTFYNVVTRVQEQLRKTPANQKLRQDLLTDASKGMANVAKGAENSPLLARTRLAAYQHMGDIARELGRVQEALAHYEQYRALVESIAAEDPSDQIAIYNRGIIYRRIAETKLQLTGDSAAARDDFRRSLVSWRTLFESPLRAPELKSRAAAIKEQLARAYARLGDLSVYLGDPRGSWEAYRHMLQLQMNRDFASPGDALPAAESNPKLFPADISRHLGDVSFRIGNRDAAQGWYDRALKLSRAAAAKDKDGPAGEFELAASLATLGDFELQVGNSSKAREHFAESKALFQKMSDRDPESAKIRYLLARSHYRVGAVFVRLGDASSAADEFAKSLTISEKLSRDDPLNIDYMIALMLAQARCQKPEDAGKLAEDIRARVPHNPAVLVQIACCYALCASAARDSTSREHFERLALESLQQSIQRGYADKVALENDPDLEQLRKHPGFQAALASLAL